MLHLNNGPIVRPDQLHLLTINELIMYVLGLPQAATMLNTYILNHLPT